MQNLQISIPITVVAALFAFTVLWIVISKQSSVGVQTVVEWKLQIQAVVVVVVNQRPWFSQTLDHRR